MEDAYVLTVRELEILSLTGSGHSAQEIADLLSVSRCAVENHRRRIYRKLGVAGPGQAVFRGLLGLPGNVPRPAEVPGRDLVVVQSKCPIAFEVVARALIECGRALAVLRDALPYDEDALDWAGIRCTAVLVDPVAADWALPARLGALAVAVPSAAPQAATVAEAIANGAQAVLWLRDVPDHLCAVLDLVSKDYLVVGAGAGRPLNPVPRLTAREADVLRAIALGHTIRQTARLLGIASKTVESTRARLFRKLGAHNSAEALTIAYRAGLVAAGPPGERPRTGLTGPGSPGPPARR
ncbi:DNA-binding response regulator, NarL/FixJ family, contains REC and HTH domains [Nonomuraea solani]|uniref:DNA-binding response regulator, NarL/FixJ family, contains REC and HTH domains n=1 Tax=Nonomuraea solani TaxID=1144553 RepID=A0A1H6ER37_9ACTN|nr:LuxR C-terminal-related transcriptional regulator [Nonomuraea solani]SEH00318.1 DNA-binding response regulator, NarL/FixJ family, contains REC and HTH domains [Nonomuraea solani]